MSPRNVAHHPFRIAEYDSVKRRLWILGQRCHHGATGSIVAGVAALGLLAEPVAHHQSSKSLPLLAIAAGGALMAHDWKDRTIWFERGYGTQP
jgi:hypothetical protein